MESFIYGNHDEIINNTNRKIADIKEKYTDSDRTEFRELDRAEFCAFIGVLYYSSIFKSSKEDLEALFATDGTGRDIFRCIMSLKRLLVILACLRSDDADSRTERKQTDAAAPISWLFQQFVNNSQSGEMTCIDEMLIRFRGRCKFRTYLPNKPNKYGLKVMILCDARTHYTYV